MVQGPKDIGKTAWASVFLGIIPMKFVASITQEAQFSLSMINDDTQLVFLDEWPDRTLVSHIAKVVFQGGFIFPGHKAWNTLKHEKSHSILHQN